MAGQLRCSIGHCRRMAAPGYKRCDECRADARAKVAERLKGETPVHMGYRQRCLARRRLATAAWTARNPERRSLSLRVNQLVGQGKIHKPYRCQDCDLIVLPLVAWGIEWRPDRPADVTVGAWCCWGCWWARKRRQPQR